MQLNINNNQFSCTRRSVTPMGVAFFGVEPEPLEISGFVALYRDDGFLLSVDDADNYCRKIYSGTTLQLTNEPEPPIPPEPPQPEPTEPSADDILNLLLGVTE